MNPILSKVEHAKRLFDELEVELTVFLADTPYIIKVKREENTNKPIYYVASVQEIPREIALKSGDILQNLRSALDHTAYYFFAKSSPGALGRHIYFPIAETAERYEEEKVKRTRGIPQEVLSLIDSRKPYKEGNGNLWRLHELNNIDKHRLLIAVGSSFHSLNIGAHLHRLMKGMFPEETTVPDFFLSPKEQSFPLKENDVLFTGGPNEEVIADMQFRFDIVLHEPGIVEGAPLLIVLRSIVNEVEETILSFKSLF